MLAVWRVQVARIVLVSTQNNEIILGLTSRRRDSEGGMASSDVSPSDAFTAGSESEPSVVCDSSPLVVLEAFFTRD